MSGGSDVRVSDEERRCDERSGSRCEIIGVALTGCERYALDLRDAHAKITALEQQLAAAQEQATQAERAGMERAAEIAENAGNDCEVSPPSTYWTGLVSGYKGAAKDIRAALPADPSAVLVNKGVER